MCAMTLVPYLLRAVILPCSLPMLRVARRKQWNILDLRLFDWIKHVTARWSCSPSLKMTQRLAPVGFRSANFSRRRIIEGICRMPFRPPAAFSICGPISSNFPVLLVA